MLNERLWLISLGDEYKLIFFYFQGNLLWVFSPDTCMLYSTCMFPFYNIPILFVLNPNFRHTWMGTISIFCQMPNWLTFLNEFYNFKSFVGTMFPVNQSGATAHSSLQTLSFNCRLIYILYVDFWGYLFWKCKCWWFNDNWMILWLFSSTWNVMYLILSKIKQM